MALVDKVWESVSHQHDSALEALHGNPADLDSSDSTGRSSLGGHVNDLIENGDIQYVSSDAAQVVGWGVMSFESDVAETVSHKATVGDFTKRAVDIVGSLSLLIILLPLLVALGGVVSSDGGVAIFSHERVGRGGRTFRCLKFRSMVKNADTVLSDLLANDPQARAEWERDFKLKNDVRITRIGRILRRTSLDELPQLWNVLRGDMSLVGPRPIVQKELPRYGTDARFYLMVKPGMTGLWQVSGRNNVDYATRVSLDVSYVKDRSFLLDVTILFRTFKVVFEKDGAY